MDHRISKDMISNGMTPSGQRSQQDLSRSQYGSAATPASLAEAYRKIHEMNDHLAEADSLAAMQARREKRLAAQRKREGTTASGRDFGHDYSLSDKQQKARKDAEFKAGLEKRKTKKEEVEHVNEAGGPALPGEPGRPGTPKAPGGRPHLPGEKQTPKPKGTPGLRLAGVDLFDIVKGYLMSEGLSEEDALKKMLEMTEEEKAEIVEMNAGPSTPVKEYDGKIMPNYGGGRIGKVRPKKGQV